MIVVAVYGLYILLLVFEDTPKIDVSLETVLWYTPYIQTVDISVPYLALIVFGLGVLLGRIFLDTMRMYRGLFAAYMISDFLMIAEHKRETD